MLEATLPRQASSSHAEQGSQDVEAKINHSKELFSKIAEEDGLKDRSGFLALLELDKRSVAHGLSKGEYYYPTSAITFLIRYVRFKSDGDIDAAILRAIRRQSVLF